MKPRFSHSELLLLVILFSATAIVATGIQMGNALFPSLSRLMNVPVGTVTLLVSVWAFTGLLSPLFGPASDRYGHGAFVLTGLGSFAIGNILCAIAPNFSALLVFQVLVGLGYAVFNFSASAVVGDVFTYEVRARALSIVRIAVSVTALVGVPAAAAIAGLLTLVVWATIPTGVFVYLAAWLEKTFQLTDSQIGLAFSTAGVGGLIGNGLTAAWVDRLGKKRSALLGLLALSATAMLLPHLAELAAALLCFAVLVAALEFSTASIGTLMTELAPDGRGTLMSLASLAIGIGTGAAPPLMRPLWENGGYSSVTLTLGVVGVGLAIAFGILVVEPEDPAAGSGRMSRDSDDNA